MIMVFIVILEVLANTEKHLSVEDIYIGEEREYIKKVETGLQNKYGFDIDNHLISFYGICKECKID